MEITKKEMDEIEQIMEKRLSYLGKLDVRFFHFPRENDFYIEITVKDGTVPDSGLKEILEIGSKYGLENIGVAVRGCKLIIVVA